ncbi:MAG TPA: PIN domain-containing protein [Vicinamibacterales bacterium]|nr:PIN domain-containing protein [Vicinamibacterales bacterium]
MVGFVLARSVFVGTVVYTSWAISPIAEHPIASASLGVVIALTVVAVEARLRETAVTSLLGGLLGFGVGLWLANTIVGALSWSNTSNTQVQFLHGLIVVVLPFLGMMLGARRGEWLEPARFVSLFKDARPQKRYKILDTSVIIDGRVAEVVETGFLDGTLVVPQFVLKELQAVADSSDQLKRNRGRRGLDILQRIQKMAGVEVVISDMDFPQVREVDLKLIELARSLIGQIVTNDFNLNKVAQLRGVAVLNINELSNVLKPVVLPGEVMSVFIIKEGKEPAQGVAYLDDGTMVVVDNARQRIGKTINIAVTSVLQTTAGRMIFGKGIEPGVTGAADSPVRPVERDDQVRRRSAAQA